MSVRGGWLWAALSLILLPVSPVWAQELKIYSFAYDQHFNPGEPIPIKVQVVNHEATTQFAEVDVSIANIDTNVESTLTPVFTGNVSPGTIATFEGSYLNVPAGLYTISFTLFDGNGVRLDQARGKYPLHIGTETETLRVFPEVIHFGSIPPGRTMHPMPIEVSWNFYRFNRNRWDQPFAVRIYTDNAARYIGIPNAIQKSSPGGLISLDGRYVIPVKVWTTNFGPDIQETGWDGGLAGPPPVDEDDYWRGPTLLEGRRNENSAAWIRLPDLADMTPNPAGWRRLIGQDPFDTRFVADANPTGDFRLDSPFTLYFATEAGASAVEGSYSANVIVELWTP